MEHQEVPQLGPILLRERKARHLTLEGLAALSGVSKSMLSQIERGEANPTFAVLWQLTRALRIDFAELVAGSVAEHGTAGIELVTLALTPEIRSPQGQWRLRILSPPDLVTKMEWYELELPPGGKLSSAPHAPGTNEHLTALSDGLKVETAHGVQPISAGETARYRADVEHEISNDSKTTARALMVVMYQQ